MPASECSSRLAISALSLNHLKRKKQAEMDSKRIQEFLRRSSSDYQLQIMRKTHETQLEVKNCLIKNLEDIIDEQEARIFNLESYNAGLQALSPRHQRTLKGVTVLTNQINTLLCEKVDLIEENEKLKKVDTTSEDFVEKALTSSAETQCNIQEKENIKPNGNQPHLEERLEVLSNHNAHLQGELEQIRTELIHISEENKLLETRCASLSEQSNSGSTLQCQNLVHVKKLEEKSEEVKILEMKTVDLQKKVEIAEDANKKLKQNNSFLSENVISICKGMKALKIQQLEICNQLYSNQGQTEKQVVEIKQQIVRHVTDCMAGLVKRYKKEIDLRKLYYNRLVELKGNIRVLCRVRPTINDEEEFANNVTFDEADDSKVEVVNPLGRSQTFIVDRVFQPHHSQSSIFDEIRPIVTSCIDGYNVCIFAYGQTGSGKTYTMDGIHQDPGINVRAVSEFFDETEARRPDWMFNISVSMLEIYNEKIRDLLCSSDNQLDIKLCDDGTGVHVPGLSQMAVENLDDVMRLFAVGRQNRATSCTNMNEHSSRSHALLCITLAGHNTTTNSKTVGKLNLVDLAGSERVGRSAACGSQLKEAQAINKSLSSLGDVISALKNKKPHIPYRNSKLTYLLKDCLGGDSKTLMVVQVAPGAVHSGETICSLDFGQRVRGVELGQATVKNGGQRNGTVSPAMTNNSNESYSNSSEDERLGNFSRNGSRRLNYSFKKAADKTNK